MLIILDFSGFELNLEITPRVICAFIALQILLSLSITSQKSMFDLDLLWILVHRLAFPTMAYLMPLEAVFSVQHPELVSCSQLIQAHTSFSATTTNHCCTDSV